jgi:hypothetical protein
MSAWRINFRAPRSDHNVCLARAVGLAAVVFSGIYAYSFVFFTGTVVYAIVNSTTDYSALTADVGASMTVHGAIMVIAGIGFGLAVIRAGVLPSWAGMALATGVVAVAATQAAPQARSWWPRGSAPPPSSVWDVRCSRLRRSRAAD